MLSSHLISSPLISSSLVRVSAAIEPLVKFLCLNSPKVLRQTKGVPTHRLKQFFQVSPAERSHRRGERNVQRKQKGAYNLATAFTAPPGLLSRSDTV